MVLPISMPVAMSAIRALVRFRERVDGILALREASAELPFVLPGAPNITASHVDAMLAFFDGEQGALFLELRDMRADFERVKGDPFAASSQEAKRRVFQVYYEVSGEVPVVLGPDDGAGRATASPQMRLAYYVVSAHRLSRNKALPRILLATADTLLEVLGENSGLFIANPKTRAVVETLIREFAVERDFDDAGGEEILRSLLGAAIVAATEHGSELSDKPALGALFGALADVREALGGAHGDELVAGIVSRDGFQALLGRYLVHVADDPAFAVDDERLRAVLAATLEELGTKLPAILEDPKALFGVLEVTLTAAAGQVEGLLEGELGERPLLTAVLVAVAGEIERRGRDDQLFASVASGEILTGIFRTSLATIAENPELFGAEADVDELVAQFVAGVAEVLSTKELADVLTLESMREIAARGLNALAENPGALSIDSEFATRVVVGVLRASSSAIVDGLDLDDLQQLAGVAVRSATQNLGLLEMDERLLVVLEALGESLSDDGIKALLSPEWRKAAVLEVLEAVAVNPSIWSGFDEAELVQPLVVGLLKGLSSDPSHLLSGPVLVDALHGVLTAVARRGNALIEDEVSPALLQQLLTMSLAVAAQEIGRSLDGENLPDYLKRVVSAFLAAPFDLVGVGAPEFRALTDAVLKKLEAA